MAQQVEDRAHHLGLTPEAVRILHARVSRQMRRSDLGIRHESPDRLGRLDLAALTAELVDPGVEWGIGSLGRLGRQCSGDQCTLKNDVSLEKCRHCIGGRKLGAVQEGEPFLGTEMQRFEAGLGKGAGRRRAAPGDQDLTRPDHRRGHVRQGRKVA